MRKVDLHLHTYASDGEWSAERMLEELDKNEVKIFAVTDHDDVGCVSDMAELTKERGDLTYIKGVEGTVTYRGIEHHILTYFIDEKEGTFLEMIAHNREVRNTYNYAIMNWFQKDYPQVSVEGYKAYKYNPYQGGWRALAYLRDQGVISDIWDYFQKIKGFTHEKVFHNPKDYLSKMKTLGYKTVLAHPPAYTEGDLYEEEHLDYFREIGLDGIECYNQYLKDPDNAEYYLRYCNQHNMLITGGSDCHGSFAGRRIGYPDVDEGMIRLL